MAMCCKIDLSALYAADCNLYFLLALEWLLVNNFYVAKLFLSHKSKSEKIFFYPFKVFAYNQTYLNIIKQLKSSAPHK